MAYTPPIRICICTHHSLNLDDDERHIPPAIYARLELPPSSYHIALGSARFVFFGCSLSYSRAWVYQLESRNHLRLLWFKWTDNEVETASFATFPLLLALLSCSPLCKTALMEVKSFKSTCQSINQVHTHLDLFTRSTCTLESLRSHPLFLTPQPLSCSVCVPVGIGTRGWKIWEDGLSFSSFS